MNWVGAYKYPTHSAQKEQETYTEILIFSVILELKIVVKPLSLLLLFFKFLNCKSEERKVLLGLSPEPIKRSETVKGQLAFAH